MPKLLIIDDNEDLLIGLKMFLNPHFNEIKTLKSPKLLMTTLQNDNYDLILLDMNFVAGVNTGNEGIYWMRQILDYDPQATIVLITAYGDVELAVKAIKEGAADFIQKSWDEGKILSTILNALKLRQSKLEINSLKKKQKHLTEKIDNKYHFCIGKSAAMQQIINTIEKVAATDANILILGENGTGKEVVAREIHNRSKRQNEIFVSADLGALPETLFESEMFGYMKGAFTDAKENKPGRFEIASGGTLFLDEIGNLPLAQQSKLLAVLQNREVVPLGSTQKIPIDVRLVCATNASINEMVTNKQFREDLLYRINTIQIEIPPLRNRSEDIPVLAEFFLNIYASKYHKDNLKFSRSAIEKMLKHLWPGNVRELQHAIEKAVILSDSNVLTDNDFSFNQKYNSSMDSFTSFNLEENEKQIILKAIEKNKGNMSQTAKELGINRSTLYEKIKKYDIN